MSYVVRIIAWENRLLSAGVFAGGLVFLISCLRWSVLSVTTNSLLYIFLASLLSKLYVHLMGFMKKPCKDPLTELQKVDLDVDVEEVVKEVARKLKTVLEQARDLLLAHDIEKSAKFCLFLYLLTYLGAICDTLPLLILCWTASFTLPPLLDHYRPQIDYLTSNLTHNWRALNGRLAANLQRNRKHTRFSPKEK